MKTTLERAARALCELDGQATDAKVGPKSMWQDYLPEVRAVFEAIRHPSLDLVATGGQIEDLGGTPIGALRAEAVWVSMIERALTKPS
ncbi:hypothetical protein [Novosphingobium sp. AP12]|uniref:hypothetical protein n=1 Tax=Novosphingobium sp. AP12 TaxID=1144305 RepID=UPI0002720040|nr:hypothetical protein [Novosphingobium sp. AP12]EJL28684.1 hypothetical protein PMI02_02520 [Novosphingobium sp. AP12]